MAGSSSANLGLAHATGVAARRVGVAAGILLILVAFLPQFAQLIMLLPAAVIGAIMIYTAAYMMVSGMELILSRLLNGRRRATVGFSVAAYRRIGGLEILAVTGLLVGLAIPIVGALAAVGLVLLLAGAVITHLRNGDGIREIAAASR